MPVAADAARLCEVLPSIRDHEVDVVIRLERLTGSQALRAQLDPAGRMHNDHLRKDAGRLNIAGGDL